MPLSQTQLAHLSIRAERFIGVNGGGMDQSCCLFSQPLSCLFIQFHPILHATPLPLPPNIVFIVANSRVVSEKAKGVEWKYNVRVVETRLAAKLLLSSASTLKHIYDHYMSISNIEVNAIVDALEEIERVLLPWKGKGISWQEAANLLRLPVIF